ncbi:MAG: L,D-transpeptidase [Chitinophagaceae bacterium]|nr:L,D-transpeptidase [Chitinophagaceae bacterium]MBK8298853.1 L,D-transpeptidase [Chitinophagaceae bacterium]MBK9464677.1 L,D-transpeptidase [Chitinophagaceae bacterium]MBK9659966.1 L,D-transpeptidase [Chitinophagaceae bacterium]MBK9938119.1 L,D-transpeptidase [Chitinophagaceae bacterium]
MHLLLAGIFYLFTSSSSTDNQTTCSLVSDADTTIPFSREAPMYHFDTLKGKTAVTDFYAKYDTTELEIILAINRINKSVIKKDKVLVMPDTLLPELLFYSPYPESLQGFDTLPKLVLISRRIQAFAIYENGKLTRWGPVSSGKKSTPTPAGLFHTNFKAKVKISSENSDWIMPWYFNFYAKRGIAMHQFFLPGYPASHACVRMQAKDAKWIFDWADTWKVSAKTGAVTKTGTPVIIFGDYAYGTTQPWLNLPIDKYSTMITPIEMDEINSYLPVINTDVVLRTVK